MSATPTTHEKSGVNEFGLLAVPEDCEMPEINWEDYDEYHQSHSPRKSSNEQGSSLPPTSESLMHVSDQRHSSTDNHQRQIAEGHQSGSYPNNATGFVRSHETIDEPPLNRTKKYNNTHTKNVKGSANKNLRKPHVHYRATVGKSKNSNQNLNKPKKPGRFWCDLCKVPTTSQITMDAHLKGNKHRSNLNRKRFGANNQEQEAFSKKSVLQTSTELRNTHQKKDPVYVNESKHKRFASGPSTNGLQKWDKRTSKYQCGGNSSQDLSAAHPSAPRHATQLGESARNGHRSVHVRLGVRDDAGSNAPKSDSSPIRSSLCELQRNDTGGRATQLDKAPIARESSFGAASKPRRSFGAIYSTTKNGPHRRSGEATPYRAQNVENIARSQHMQSTHSEFDERNPFGITGQRLQAERAKDTVQTLKPIPWDPFVREYDASKIGFRKQHIPRGMLDTPMSISEWREMRRAVIQKGDDVDKLAFKIMVEMLLSPTLGIREDALDGLNSAIEKMKNVHFYSKETGAYMHSDCVPEKLWKRESRFVEGDQEWQKDQDSNDLALHLLCENLHYIFEQAEDFDCLPREADPKELPFRGGVLGFRKGKKLSARSEGGRRRGKDETVENDELFRQIHHFKINQGGHQNKKQLSPRGNIPGEVSS